MRKFNINDCPRFTYPHGSNCFILSNFISKKKKKEGDVSVLL